MYDLDSIYWISSINFVALLLLSIISIGQDRKIEKNRKELESKLIGLKEKLKAILTIKD